MLALILAVTLETAPPLPQSQGKADAQCVGSPARLGTGNIPPDGGKGTSIINIWAYQAPNKTTADAWLYITTGHTLYVQYRSWPTTTAPQRVNYTQLARIDAEFARKNVLRHKCFAQDFVGAQ